MDAHVVHSGHIHAVAVIISFVGKMSWCQVPYVPN